ncbi:MAG TPA: DUF4249 domain-containing protein [Mucilaginibacter sp.]|jgi:hypothetical protein|nr:DUF4249 domain-containing protein [Mucilaginibacter sp.]
MNKGILYITLILIGFAATSCTKVIDLKLNNDTGILVIEGNITNIPGMQHVKLSQNVPFTGTNTYPPVTGANVIVSDNSGNNYQFKEGPAGTYSINAAAGIAGRTYTMKVITNGKTYTATSVIPAPVTLDSISSKPGDFNKSKNLRNIVVHYQDPAGTANQYRFVLYVNSVQVNDVFAYNDEFIDGRYVNLELLENNINIHPGDTAKVEFQCIDKPVYTYWYTLMEQQQNAPGGGGVTPSNPPTNISPATLGYFSAHTTRRETIIVK